MDVKKKSYVGGNHCTALQLKAEQDKITKLKAFDSSYFRGKSHFQDDGTENYLVFQQMDWYFKEIVNTYCILGWKSERLSDESIKAPTITNNSLLLQD